MAQDLEVDERQAAGALPQPPVTGGDAGRTGQPAANVTRARRSFFANPIRILLAVVIVAILVAGGMGLWTYESSFETTDDAQVDGHIYPVSPRVSGRVTEVNADSNDLVKEGQVLVKLDPADYQVAVRRAEADLRQSQADAQVAEKEVPITDISTSSQVSTAGASVEEATQAISVAEQQSEAAQARVREAEANALKAQKDVERYRPLAEKQEISQQQFDQAVASANALAATVETAKANAGAATRQVTQARAHLAQAQAQQSATLSTPQQIAAQRARAVSSEAAIGVQGATVEQSQLNLQYTIIVAPVSGVVGQRSVQVGQQVQPGQELMSVIPLDGLWITANFKETQVQHMRAGQKVKVNVDATGRDYDGQILNFPGATGAKYSMLPPENATGNYVKVVQRLPVKIVLDAGADPDHLLRPGMSAEPKVSIK